MEESRFHTYRWRRVYRRATNECAVPPLDIGVWAIQLSPYRVGVAGPCHTRLLTSPAFQPCSCPLALSGLGKVVASESSALNSGHLWWQFRPCVTRRTLSAHPALQGEAFRCWDYAQLCHPFPFDISPNFMGLSVSNGSRSVPPLASFPRWTAFPSAEYSDASDAFGRPWWTAHLRIRPKASHVHRVGLQQDQVGGGSCHDPYRSLRLLVGGGVPSVRPPQPLWRGSCLTSPRQR
jgi:hypothetical protein